jgi:hypothetical protein
LRINGLGRLVDENIPRVALVGHRNRNEFHLRARKRVGSNDLFRPIGTSIRHDEYAKPAAWLGGIDAIKALSNPRLLVMGQHHHVIREIGGASDRDSCSTRHRIPLISLAGVFSGWSWAVGRGCARDAVSLAQRHFVWGNVPSRRNHTDINYRAIRNEACRSAQEQAPANGQTAAAAPGYAHAAYAIREQQHQPVKLVERRSIEQVYQWEKEVVD